MSQTETDLPIAYRIRGLEQRPLVGGPGEYIRHLVEAGFNVSNVWFHYLPILSALSIHTGESLEIKNGNSIRLPRLFDHDTVVLETSAR